jgi:hypothetical protein
MNVDRGIGPNQIEMPQVLHVGRSPMVLVYMYHGSA